MALIAATAQGQSKRGCKALKQLTIPGVKMEVSRAEILPPLTNGNSRLLLNSVGVLLVLLLAPSVSCMAGANYFYTPQSVGKISGRAYADGDAPVHWLNMTTFRETSSAVSQTISGWNVGDFTGVESPTPVGEYQLGIDNAAYRSSAVQMTNTTMGAMVNTYTIPGGSGYNNNLANAQVQYKRNASDNIKPWPYSTSNFNFSFYLQVPKSYFTGGAVGYGMPASWLPTGTAIISGFSLRSTTSVG